MSLIPEGCEALVPGWLYEHLPVANRVTNDLDEFSCQTIIRRAEDGQSSCLSVPLRLGLHTAFSSQLLRHYITLPIDRTNGYDNSYLSHTDKPFGSSLSPLPSILLL